MVRVGLLCVFVDTLLWKTVTCMWRRSMLLSSVCSFRCSIDVSIFVPACFSHQ